MLSRKIKKQTNKHRHAKKKAYHHVNDDILIVTNLPAGAILPDGWTIDNRTRTARKIVPQSSIGIT